MVEEVKSLGKTVIITGASKGIGFEIAKNLVIGDHGFGCVVMIARPSHKFNEAVEYIRALGRKCKLVPIEADLSDHEVISRIYDELDALKVRVDTIINNAGFTKPAPIHEAEMSDFIHTMCVNLYSPFRIIQEALRRNYPLEQIINIASTVGIGGRAGWLTYSASKAAVINMSEVLREELAPQGIDVACLSPGRCATDLRRVLAPDENPLTIMQPAQVAQVVAMMTSDTGKLLHSQNLVVRSYLR